MDTSALRVVLNVTETNMIETMRAEMDALRESHESLQRATETNMIETMRAEMDTLRESQESLQRAYHLQQTLLRYATQFLDVINIRTGTNPMTEMTMDELEATLGAIAENEEYDGPQYVLNILRNYEEDDDEEEEDFMVFVNPMTFGSPDSRMNYLYIPGEKFADYHDSTPSRFNMTIDLEDLELLASFIHDFPTVYSMLMEKTEFGGFPNADYNTPAPGFVAF